MNKPGILESSLRSRLEYLTRICEQTPSEEIVPVIIELISSKYDEKPFKTALLSTTCQLIAQYHSIHHNIGNLLEELYNEWIYLSSGSKGIYILSIIDHIYSKLDFIASASTEDTKLTKILILNITEYLYFKEKHSLTSIRKLSVLFKRVPSLAAMCIDVTDLPAATPTTLTILSIIATKVFTPSEEYMSLLLGEIVRKVVSAKSPPLTGTIEGISSLFSSLSQDDWCKHLEGTLSKMIKKSPESASFIVASVISMTNTDLSIITKEGMAASALRLVKSSSEECQTFGSSILQNLSRRCNSADAFLLITTALLEALQGKGGLLTSTTQKLVVINALTTCAQHASNHPDVCPEASCRDNTRLIISCFEKEADYNCQRTYSGCLGHWIGISGDLSKETITSLSTLTKKSKEIGQYVLGSIVLSLQLRPSIASSLLPLETLLIDLIKESTKRPQLAQIDGVLSMNILLKLSLFNPKVADSLTSSKLWTVFSTSSSFLYGLPTIVALQALGIVDKDTNASRIFQNTVILSTLESLAIMAKQYSSHLTPLSFADLKAALSITESTSGTLEPHDLISSALLQGDNTNRALMIPYLRDLFQASPSCVLGVLISMRKSFHNQCISDEIRKAVDLATYKKGGDADSTDMKAPPRTSMYSEAMKVLIGSIDKYDALTVINLLVTICNPLVAGLSLKQALILWRLPALQSNMALASENLNGFSTLLFQYASHTSPSLQLVSHHIFSLLGLHSGSFGIEVLHRVLLPELAKAVHRDNYAQISDEEISLYMNPILSGVSAIEVSLADIKITNEDRKKAAPRSSRKGAFESDLAEDEDWAEQIKKEKAKKMTEAKQNEYAELQVKRSKEVEAVRAKLDGVVYKVGGALRVIYHIIQCQPQLISRRYDVVDVIVSCLDFPLVADIAFQCILSLITDIDAHMNSFARNIADSLRLIYTSKYQKSSDSKILLEGPLSRVVRGMQAIVGRGIRLEPTAIHLIYLVIEHALSQQSMIPGCEMSFMILDFCWANPSDDNRVSDVRLHAENIHAVLRPILPRIFSTILYVLARFRVEPSPESVLLRIASTTKLNEVEWGVILSERGILASEVNVRLACLKLILDSAQRFSISICSVEISTFTWLAMNYEEENVIEIATKCMEACSIRISGPHLDMLFKLLHHSGMHVHIAASKALGWAISLIDDSSDRDTTIQTLQNLFDASSPRRTEIVEEKSKSVKMTIPLVPKKAEEDTKWRLRKSVFIALSSCCLKKALSGVSQVESLLKFILLSGVIDTHQEVRDAALAAGLTLIENYGSNISNQLYIMVDDILNAENPKNESPEITDYRHEAAVILLGAIGGHLDKDDPNIIHIASSLMEALNTPSERVQRAVADCLSPIIAALKANEKAAEFLEALMSRIELAETYGERRGAAFGLSAVVKGLGISSLKQFDIAGRLKNSCSEGSVGARQGSLFAFECLSDRLGLLFEPSVIPIVPILLKSFSHSSDHVREAAHMAAKVILGKLSAHGVKQVLNPILTSLAEETQWKSRQESIRLLGAMAHLSPKSLATSLPQIIPRLVEAGNDVHPKVKESAKFALQDISSVIKNPEVAALSPVLLDAIADPANKTKQALEVLLSCEFMHSIDAPSLALLIPILARALKDRSADVKRKSSAIMGNITSMLSEPKIVCPYLSQIMPGLKDSLLDPIPDVRTMSAKAIGSLIGGVGEEECPDIVPWLLNTLKGEDSPVERSGAAQGLAEVSLVLGNERLHSILSDVIKYKNHPKSAAREGLLWLLSFLPAVLNEAFAEHIFTTLPVVIVGLSDAAESVREVAMRAGRIMVQCMGLRHSLELMPSLRSGLFDEDSRIRHSSVILLGELLYLIGDTKALGFVDAEDDDEGGGFESVSRAASSIKVALGDNNFSLCLASLYTVRFDATSGVRQTSLQIWKSIVNNTPRALVDIMPTLIDTVVMYLSSEVYDLRFMASRCLGEVVRKLGNKVLTLLIPCLKEGLENGDKHNRQGVCLGLSEILSSLSKDQVESYANSFIPSLQQALCDYDDDVRSQAASAFQTLSRCIGSRAIDEIVPSLVEQLSGENSDSASALLGLKEIVQLRPRDLLEYLLPKLLKSPIDSISAKVLGTVAQVTGHHLHHHFTFIVNQLVTELTIISKESVTSEDRLNSMKSCASNVMGSVTSTGVNHLIIELGKHIENDSDALKRRWGCWLTEQFLLNSSANFIDYVSVILKYLLSRVADRDKNVLTAVLGALVALNIVIPVDEYIHHLSFISSSISSAASDARFRTASASLVSSTGQYTLPLFTLAKSLDAFVPMLLHALTNGTADARESAANILGELVLMCDPEVLKPFLIKITGPLIRVVGDRFPSSVKAAILETLCVLLDRGGASLKAFAPQLQTTFVKSLNDPTRQVRVAASNSLNQLIALNLTARVDPLISELASVVSQSDSNAIKSSVFDALASVLKHSADKVTQGILLERVEPVVILHIEEGDDNVRMSAITCIGHMAPALPVDHVNALIESFLSKRADDATSSAGRLLASISILCCSIAFYEHIKVKVFESITNSFRSNEQVLKHAACSGVCMLLKGGEPIALTACDHFSSDISRAARDSNAEVRFAAIKFINDASKMHYSTAKKHIPEFMPALITAVQDATNIKMKYMAERAMYHLLQGGSNPALINAYATTASGQDIAFVKDYAKRFLSKQSENSDDEESKW